ncbi:hypothetical protein RQP46_000733 [Phenoliferia psychrophenolica]
MLAGINLFITGALITSASATAISPRAPSHPIPPAPSHVVASSLTNPLLGLVLNSVVGTLATDPVFALLSPATAPGLRTANSVAGPINKVVTAPLTAPIIAMVAQTTGDFEAPSDCLTRPLTGTGVYGCDGGGVLSSAQGPVGGEPYTGQLDPFGNDYYAPDKPKGPREASVADGGNPTSETPAVDGAPAAASASGEASDNVESPSAAARRSVEAIVLKARMDVV